MTNRSFFWGQRIIFFGLFFFSSPGFAKLHEVNTMREALRETLKTADKNTLIVFDIDNTIIRPVQTLGSDQWFRAYLEELSDKGDAQALDHALQKWLAVQRKTDVVLVENETPDLIRQLKAKGIKIMALTARLWSLARTTDKQLTQKSVGVDFNANTVTSRKIELKKNENVFAHGILYLGAKEKKGEQLIKFFKLLDLKPSHIVFVDDRKRNVDNVDEDLTAAGISIDCYRYGFTDPLVKAYSTEVARKQLQVFDHLLSDEDAKILIDEQKRNGL